MKKQKLIVIGGGAAGFFCAINAASLNPDLQVIIIERTAKILSKVSISGGGRCNVTHNCFSIAEMVKKYPRGSLFLKKAFHHFFTTDTIRWFKERGVELKTESDGRMFPVSDNSETIVQCFMSEVNKLGIEMMMRREVKKIYQQNNIWQLDFADGQFIKCNYLCIACGGFPKLSQFEWLSFAGHHIIPPVPSLFTFNMPGNSITALMGISVNPVSIKLNGSKLISEGPALITHWGLSGPAVLQLSAMAARELSEASWNFSITVNWLPSFHEQQLRDALQQFRHTSPAQKLYTRCPFDLPLRLWQYILILSGISDQIRWADLPAKEQSKLAKNCCQFECAVSGKTTFKEEFVTAGGIDTNEVDHNTMESKKMSNLYFSGEILNIDGITGGFNFQNAWTTGFIAAKSIAEKSNNFD